MSGGGHGLAAVGMELPEAADRALGPPEAIVVRLLSFAARVASNCPLVLRDVASLYAATAPTTCRGELGAAPHFAITEYRRDGYGPCYRLSRADRGLRVFRAPRDAVAHLEYLVNAAAARALARNLLVHAGVVATGRRGILLPGASGQGKSTLVAALCLAGFTYFSDELAVLDGESLSLLPFLKAICLKDGGWQMLAGSFEAPPPLLGAVRVDGEAVRYLPAPNPCSPDGRAEVRHVVVPVRQPGAAVALALCSPARALAELARHSLNLPRHGRRGVESLAGLVERASCFTLTYDDLRGAVGVISDLAGQRRLVRG